MNHELNRLDVVGRWSVDVLDSPGAMSDYELFLGEDGIGYLGYESLAGIQMSVLRSLFEGDRLTNTPVSGWSTPLGNFEPPSTRLRRERPQPRHRSGESRG